MDHLEPLIADLQQVSGFLKERYPLTRGGFLHQTVDAAIEHLKQEQKAMNEVLSAVMDDDVIVPEGNLSPIEVSPEVQTTLEPVEDTEDNPFKSGKRSKTMRYKS